MKKLFLKLLIFSLPILIYMVLAIVIDPYGIFHANGSEKMQTLKSGIALKLSYPLSILPTYDRNPSDVIVLGDSRSGFMSEKIMDSVAKVKTANLAFGGASLKEVTETFWYVSKNKKLKEVYIGVSFMQYNKYNQRNRVTEAVELIHSPFSYLFSNFCLKSTFLISKSLLTNEEVSIGVPEDSKEDFWKFQLENDAVVSYYEKYQYPQSYFNELSKIANYCKENNIKLAFFIPPTHTDLQALTNAYNRVEEDKRFIEDIRALSVLYDFNYPNSLTKNKDNFSDPHHLEGKMKEVLTLEVVSGDIEYAR